MKINKYIILVCVFALSVNIYGQKGTLSKANRDYEKFSYVKTTDVLRAVADKGFESVDLFQKLGNAYYFNNNMEEAIIWYDKLMAMDKIIDSEYYYRYAQALKYMENYQESDKWMERFAENRSDELRSKVFVSKRDYLQSIEGLSESFAVVNMDLNTALSDFGANQYKDRLVFASTRESGRLYNWNEQPYLELYSATKQEDGSYANVVNFDENINTKFHESSASFLPTDDVVYFTRNNYYRKKLSY